MVPKTNLSPPAEDKYDAENAMTGLNGTEIGGKPVKVRETPDWTNHLALYVGTPIHHVFNASLVHTHTRSPAGNRWQGGQQGSLRMAYHLRQSL